MVMDFFHFYFCKLKYILGEMGILAFFLVAFN